MPFGIKIQTIKKYEYVRTNDIAISRELGVTLILAISKT